MINSLGLKDVKIVDGREINGKLEIVLEKETSFAVCPTCQNPSSNVKDYKYSKIIDKPIESAQLQLILKKRRFFCNNPSCPEKSFTEQIDGLSKKTGYTQNFKDFLSQLYQDMDIPTIKKHLSHRYKLELPISTIHYLLKGIPFKDPRILPLMT